VAQSLHASSEVGRKAAGSVTGWAAIASALGCSVRTAQRWAKAGRLPVYKFPGTKRSRVYSRRSEITALKGVRVPGLVAPAPAAVRQETAAHTLAGDGHLWGWKAIARFVNMSVCTVQRWEDEAQLPVHRLKIGHRALPFALKGEVMAWVGTRTLRHVAAPANEITRRNFPQLLQSFLDSSTANIAVLDATGTITAVNSAWRAFAEANGCRVPDSGVGTNYLEVCRRTTGGDAATASQVVNGLVELLAGKRTELKVRYRCDSPTEKHECLLFATLFKDLGAPLLVLMHSDVTNAL